MVDRHQLGNHPAHRRADHMRAGDAQRLEQASAVIGHIPESIGHPCGKADPLAQDLPHQARCTLALELVRQADIAVVVADDAVPLAHQRLDKLVRPQRHLGAEAHHQQDHFMFGIAIVFIEQLKAIRLDMRHAHASCIRLLARLCA